MLLNLLRFLSRMIFVSNSVLEKNAVIGVFSSFYNCSIGSFSYVANFSQIRFTDIGKFCSIGKNVKINLPQHDTSGLTYSPLFSKGDRVFGLTRYQHIDLQKNKRVTIGNNVWIGDNVIITKNVKIGDNVIIGAGSIVTKNCEQNGLYAGSPARLIKTKTIEFNECDLDWWNLDIDEIYCLSKKIQCKIFKEDITKA